LFLSDLFLHGHHHLLDLLLFLRNLLDRTWLCCWGVGGGWATSAAAVHEQQVRAAAAKGKAKGRRKMRGRDGAETEKMRGEWGNNTNNAFSNNGLYENDVVCREKPSDWVTRTTTSNLNFSLNNVSN